MIRTGIPNMDGAAAQNAAGPANAGPAAFFPSVGYSFPRNPVCPSLGENRI